MQIIIDYLVIFFHIKMSGPGTGQKCQDPVQTQTLLTKEKKLYIILIINKGGIYGYK